MTVASRAVVIAVMTEASTVGMEKEEHGFELEETVVGSDPGWVVDAAVV